MAYNQLVFDASGGVSNGHRPANGAELTCDCDVATLDILNCDTDDVGHRGLG